VAGWQWYSSGKVEAKGGVEKGVEELTNNKDGVWYFEYLKDVTDPSQKLLVDLKNLRFAEVSQKSFVGVGKIIYLRR